MLLLLVARIPLTAATMVITLHVVLGLHRGYGAAGLVGAAATVGIGVGAPLAGRCLDSYGLRPVLVVTTLVDAAFWLSGWVLSYAALALCAFVAGVLSLPVMTFGRQSLAALVPERDRRTAYSMDSISVEFAYAAGPALGVLLATAVSTPTAMMGVGGGLLLAGTLLYIANPPTREASASTIRPPRRAWLGAPMVGLLLTEFGAVFALAGTEVGVVAALRRAGEISFTGVVTIVMCLASAVGGAIYGGWHREYPPAVMMGLLGLLTLPVGLLAGTWWVLALALVPTNLLCAPTLSATNDRISRLAPAAARGEAMGLAASATTVGAALGSPLIGTTVDHTGVFWGFAVAGIGGVAIAAAAYLLQRRTTAIARPHVPAVG